MKEKSVFIERYENFALKRMKLEKLSGQISNLRLASIITGALLGGLAYYYVGNPLTYMAAGLFLISFFVLVVFHDRIIKKAEVNRRLADINEACEKRKTGDWTFFADQGEEYKDPAHPYINDLDIFGRASLFQWVNTASSYYGREFLKNLLSSPDKDVSKITKRQKAVKELAMKMDFCQELQSCGMADKDIQNDPKKLLRYAEDKSRLIPVRELRYLLYILPGITLVSFFLYYSFGLPIYIPLGGFLVQIILNVIGSWKIGRVIDNLYSSKRKIESYQKMLEVAEKEHFDDEYLRELKANLFRNNIAASKEIKVLDNILGAISFRSNPIVHFIINNLFFWDFHCVLALERWKNTSGSSLRNWIYTIGTYEALCSLALTAQLDPGWCFPDFVEDGLVIKAVEMGHPLINEKERVANYFAIDDQICIVTGSNMSGKTTLLRTIGVNLVLAYAGASVCAKKFSCSILEIFTSMRINDDLNSGISTFYAELLRIKTIIEYSKKKQSMLFLIDEVFRGTNSRDRVTGAKNVLMNLNKGWIIGLISTHDFELCDFEIDDSGRIFNLHFIETYTDGEIKFDYKLREGRCKTANAKYLMKMVGIEIADK